LPGVKVEGGFSIVKKSKNPMRIPRTIRRQDSGKILESFGVI